MSACCHGYNKTETFPGTLIYLKGSIPDYVKSTVGTMIKTQKGCENILVSLTRQGRDCCLHLYLSNGLTHYLTL